MEYDGQLNTDGIKIWDLKTIASLINGESDGGIVTSSAIKISSCHWNTEIVLKESEFGVPNNFMEGAADDHQLFIFGLNGPFHVKVLQFECANKKILYVNLNNNLLIVYNSRALVLDFMTDEGASVMKVLLLRIGISFLKLSEEKTNHNIIATLFPCACNH